MTDLLTPSDTRETLHHFRTVARASDLPIMIYNNPIVYRVDIKPETFAELASEKTIVAIKESSDDPRRITDLHNLYGDRFILFCGVDDLLLESCALGIEGWVSGLTDVFPEESVELWNLCQAGRFAEARALYRWFTPLLHLDTHSKLVQYIKLGQQVGITKQTFDECRQNEKLIKDIIAVRDRANTSFGVNQTPTFFINGKKMDGGSVEDFEKALTPLIKG